MSDSDVVASLAVSLDGYIAKSDGSVEHLSRYPMHEFGMQEWMEPIGAMAMGRTAYENMNRAGEQMGMGWMWGDRPVMVLTHQGELGVPEGANVSFKSAPTAEAIRGFSAETPGRLWVFGGGQVITEALTGGAVDVLDLIVVPEALGSGIPLFSEPFSTPMHQVDVTHYTAGAIRLVYELGE